MNSFFIAVLTVNLLLSSVIYCQTSFVLANHNIYNDLMHCNQGCLFQLEGDLAELKENADLSPVGLMKA